MTELLIRRAQDGDVMAMDRLLAEWRGLAVSRTRGLYMAGGDRDDLIAEALFGLLKAVQDFQPGRSSFMSFAVLCIDRQLATAIKTADRRKHQVLSRSMDLSQPITESDGAGCLADVLPAMGCDPADICERRERLVGIWTAVRDRLTPLERAVVLASEPNEEAGQLQRVVDLGMARNYKAVDNARQRAHRKLKAAA